MEQNMNITEMTFESLSLEGLNIQSNMIETNLPLPQTDERVLLFENNKLAKVLLNSNDNDSKIFFINSMKIIFDRYIEYIVFDNSTGTYNDLLRSLNDHAKITFHNKLATLKRTINDYVNNYKSYEINFALNKIIEITVYIIEIINPMFDIQINLETLFI